MTDHLIPLPQGFRYINQFAPSAYSKSPSLSRCVTASLSMIMEIVDPGAFVPEQLEHDLYTQWAGPDVPSDQRGIDVEAHTVVPWLQKQGVPFVDLQHLVDSDMATLKRVIERMNLMGIPQLIAVRDESKLYDASGHKLHSWADQGLGHAFVRVGFSDSNGYGLYFEPAAAGFHQPVPIPWDKSVAEASVRNVIAILPKAMGQPTADFDWLTQTWPIKVPQPDLATLKAAVDAATATLDQVDHDLVSFKATLAAAQAELAKGGLTA